MKYHFLLVLLISYSFIKAQCPQVVWEDNFDGSALDMTKWNIQLGDGCDLGICGWGNNELQFYQQENVEVSDGTLKIIAKRESVGNKAYTSARITSKGKGDWTFGRFEARLKTPSGKGMWPAFWMLSSTEPYGGWPQSGEIDIMELIGSEPDQVHGTIHFGSPAPNNRSATSSFLLTEGTFADRFHTFAIEWEGSQIRWIVDDFVYSTKISSVTGGSRWPFDHNFHFLLNLAVGGNWPGFPDGGTVFPQQMEVDYVRVYDDFLPTIKGSRFVEHQATSINYQVTNLPDGSNVSWSVPDGAQIIDGQGTASITVDWQAQGGLIIARYESPCQIDSLLLQVAVAPVFEQQLVLENFDDPANLIYNSSTGMLVDEALNPDTNGVNASTLVGQYTRNSSELFDILVYDVEVLDNTGPFIEDEKRFFIDIYTDAPVGTLILLQLENSGRSQPGNYPVGRNSRFEAKTTKQGEWERLQLVFLDQPDVNTNNATIDQAILLFGSNTNLGSTFYFDNFDIHAPAETVGSRSPINKPLHIYPNPTSDFIFLDGDLLPSIQSLSLINTNGQEVYSLKNRNVKKAISRLELAHLDQGLYLIIVRHRNGSISTSRFVKI
ncbi:MAG: family 16 glycosylhydrolase [Saprospiraceae bacterium]|nr:family 16 glycosylhydrolase [Saprospiraceae bacterium]